MTGPPESEGAARLERLLERYSALLRSIIARHCPRNRGIQIADIEQDARLRLWKALQREKELTDPASYIHRIALSATIDAVRRVNARREEQLTMPPAEEQEQPVRELAADPAHRPDRAAERKELMAKVDAALVSLPENRRSVVELHLQGFSLSEIAELLRWTEPKVRNLLYRGLDDLREELRREGVDYP
ncbi:MAG TPA: sigma-70 family RNA polymerase sigma factor [Thermoanaerobaculia bacterium]